MKRLLILPFYLMLLSLFLVSCNKEMFDEEAYHIINEQLDILDLPEPEVTILAYRFFEGLSSYQELGKIGFINKEGQVIIPGKYDEGHWFSEGLASVCQDGLWGYIDKNGQVIIPLQFKNANVFQNGRASVFDGEQWYLIDRNGQAIADFDYSFIGQTQAQHFSDGYATYSIPAPSNLTNARYDTLYGYVDNNGKVAIPAQFYMAQGFQDGYAVVTSTDHRNHYINKAGEEVFEHLHDFSQGPQAFRDGLVKVGERYDGHYRKDTFYNTKGEAVFTFPPEVGEAQWYSEGVITYRTAQGKYGGMDLEGNIIIPPVLSTLVSSIGGVFEAYVGTFEPFYIRNPLWTGE